MALFLLSEHLMKVWFVQMRYLWILAYSISHFTILCYPEHLNPTITGLVYQVN